MKAREFARNMEYPDPGPDVHYPGRNSKQSMAWPQMDQMSSQIVGEPLERRGNLAHSFCRISLEGNTRTGCGVHVDPGCTWAGIIFLTLDEHCQDGLGFHRHRNYGTDRAPLNDQEAQDIFASPIRNRSSPMRARKNDRSTGPRAWKIGSVPSSYP